MLQYAFSEPERWSTDLGNFFFVHVEAIARSSQTGRETEKKSLEKLSFAVVFFDVTAIRPVEDPVTS